MTRIVLVALLMSFFSFSELSLAAGSGLKPTYREGQPGWRRLRQAAAKRRRLAANEERTRIKEREKQIADGYEIRGHAKIKRATFDYWYPVKFHVESLIRSTKEMMNEERLDQAVAAITALGKDSFSYLLTRTASGEIQVTADTLESADLAELPFSPPERGWQSRGGNNTDTPWIEFESAKKPSDIEMRDKIERVKRLMDRERIDRFVLEFTSDDKKVFSYFLNRGEGGKIEVTEDACIIGLFPAVF